MTDRFGPEAALDPSTFYRCYLGGLARESATTRLATCVVLLATGRLGLRPGELQHLHEGWIDWERGELHVPAHDPCACEDCWEAARVAQRAGDGRALAEVVATDCWSPPTDEGRTIAFGWSRRLTAVLATALDAWTTVDRSVPEMASLLRESARVSGAVDAEAATLDAMRSSAATFLADVGFDAPRIAELLGLPVERVAPFAELHDERPGDHRPGLPDENPDYRLVTDPTPLDREPVDPTTYDAEWRATREAERGSSPTGSPRPTAVPPSVEYDPPTDVLPSYHDRWRTVDTTAPGPASLAAWVDRDAAGETGATENRARADGAAADPAAGDPATDARTGARSANDGQRDPRDRMTDPVRLEASARFACQAIQGGRPAGGNVLLGGAELVLVTHGDGERVGHEVIPLHAVTDVAVGHCPEPLEAVFEETVAVAYRSDGERQVAIVELPEAQRRTVATTLFERRLDGVDVVLTHPARPADHTFDGAPDRGVLTVDGRRLAVRPDADAEPLVVLSLSDVVHAERSRQLFDGEVYGGLSLRHLSGHGGPVTSTISPLGDADRTLLRRFVIRDYRHRKRRVDAIDVEPRHVEVLRTLYADDDSRDLSTLLDRDGDELSALLDRLASLDLVRVTGGRARLTGMGQMLVSDDGDDATA